MLFTVRQIDSWFDGDGWYYNNVFIIGQFKTKAEKTSTEKKAFVRFLNKNGIFFKKNRTRIDFDGDCYQIIDRKSKEILFDAIPEY